jgi:hypothetical protein
MRTVKVALGAGLALVAVAIALVLSGSPPRVASTNSVPFARRIAFSLGGASVCQASETLPAGTSAIRLSLGADLGPKVTVKVLAGERTATHGVRGAGWAGGAVTVRVKPTQRQLDDATVCFSFTGANEVVSVWGMRTHRKLAAISSHGALAGRVRIEYLQPGRSSWWSSALSVARRIGLGRAWPGTWVVLLVMLLMLATGAIVLWLSLRELR